MLRVVAREVFAYTAQGLLLPRGRARVPATPPKPGERTVVLVHGHASHPGAFVALERALRRAGQARIAAFRYGATGTVEGLAARLDAFIAAHLGSERLILVGHSLGGLVARTWLQLLGGSGRTDAFVTLSTPHRALPLAALARPVPLLRELAPANPLWARLEASRSALAPLRCLTIASSKDHFIRPPERAHLEGAEAITLDAHGHAGLLFAPEAHRHVIRILRETAARQEASP